MKKTKVLIIDANNITMRAMHGCPPLHDSEGFPTACLMTTIRSIYKAAIINRPTYTLCVWDAGHSTYRKDIYPEYKLRKKDDSEEFATFMEDWRDQVEALECYLPFLGAGQIRIPKCEADDVIFRISEVLKELDWDATLMSSDADFFQLLRPGLEIYSPGREITYDVKTFREEYEVAPSQWVEYRAMTGDPSDNISGVKGVGAKRATAILKEFGTTEQFYQKMADCDRKLRKFEEEMLDSRKIVERNKKLMDLRLLPEGMLNQQVLADQLEEAFNLEPDFKMFTEACREHQLYTVLEERMMWKYVRG